MARNKCPVCGENCEEEYCVHHKPRKPLKRGTIKRRKVDKADGYPKDYELMWQFFLQIWKQRPHICQSCGKYLGNEPKNYFFDHLLEKSKYPEFKFKKANIFICCENCHGAKSLGHPTPIHQLAINAAKAIFINNEIQ